MRCGCIIGAIILAILVAFGIRNYNLSLKAGKTTTAYPTPNVTQTSEAFALSIMATQSAHDIDAVKELGETSVQTIGKVAIVGSIAQASTSFANSMFIWGLVCLLIIGFLIFAKTVGGA